jgi:hypothetical protein
LPGRSHGRPGEAIEVRLQLIWILGRTDRNQLLAVDTEVDPLSSLAEGGDRIEQSGGKAPCEHMPRLLPAPESVDRPRQAQPGRHCARRQ